MIEAPKGDDFFEYWESLGFFENIQVILPPKFMLIFEIARKLFTDKTSADALNAIDDISKDEEVFIPDKDKTISVNRMERSVPLGNKMEIETYRSIIDLKRALPRELAQDDDIFSAKLFTKTLMVQRFYESEADHFKPVSTLRNESGREANKFEQLFYILLDTSRSMDIRMRSFYAKCIVAEFLRRKLNSNARLFFRSFDTSTGPLYKIEKREDYPFLIEKVLFSTTGGISTNLQKAVYQAISDINYNKDMNKAEILIVTDGASRIEPFEMQEKLGPIKLHILKIGDENPEPDFYDLKQVFAGESLEVDPTTLNIKQIKEIMKNPNDLEKPLSNAEQRIYRIMLEYSSNIFKDLRKVATNYIEVGDLKTDSLYDVSYENLENIFHWIKKIETIDFRYMHIDDKEKIFKQVYFLGQYVKMLYDASDDKKAELKSYLARIAALKEKLMKDNELFMLVVHSGKYHENKKSLKMDKKEARKLMKQMSRQDKKLTVQDMKKAQLTLTFEPGGEGSAGQLFLLLLIKLGQAVLRIVTFPFNRGKKEEKEKFSSIEYIGDDDKKNHLH
ncbi:MAG TPA: hypothetical protein PKI12_07990, partial [Bacteroidales bacterium]|nr:hypothetical protein [Bacteroidales bacterium]HPS57424.1 hypothetical protein [Spirochaetota bacterium]